MIYKNSFLKFHIKSLITIFVIVLWAAFSANAQTNSSYYLGNIHISNKDSLSVGLFIQSNEDSLIIVLDSPMQYVYDIPVQILFYSKDSISLTTPSIGGSLYGSFTENRLVGTFSQNHKSFKINMKETERKRISRPQTPAPPYNYLEEDLVIQNPNSENCKIVGTLTYPKNPPKALVILISGSGWQNRDEFIMGHAPFWVIADYLSENDYAVFRYDDRPKSAFIQSTTFDFVDDVNLIIDKLDEKLHLNNIPIGLLGHSEGGLVAFMTAANNPKVDFIVTLAAPAEKISDILLYQNKIIISSLPLSEKNVKTHLNFLKKIFSMLEKTNSKEDIEKKYFNISKKYLNTLSNEEQAISGFNSWYLLQQYNSLSTPWLSTLFKIDPKKYIKQTDIDILALNGEKDSQVFFKSNISNIQKYAKSEKNLQTITYPNLNHLFQECNTGLVNEYGEIEQTISPIVLQDILKWLNKTTNNFTK